MLISIDWLQNEGSVVPTNYSQINAKPTRILIDPIGFGRNVASFANKSIPKPIVQLEIVIK
jgi:hypothetical protein